MIVASTIVPVATFSPLSARWRCTSSNSWRPRSCSSSRWRKRHTVVSHWFASEIDADKTPHRQRIVKRLLHRRAAIARLGIERLDQPAQRRPWHNPLHFSKKCCPPRRLDVALKPHCRQRQLLHPPKLSPTIPTPPDIIPRSFQLTFAEVP